MGLSDWRAKHSMRDPVRGVFRVTGFYDKHPSSSPPGTRITGVIIAPGIPAKPAEHKVDERGRWADHQELPVLVDRSDPSRFAMATPGTQLTVLIDPGDRSRLAIDTTGFRTSPGGPGGTG